MRWALGSPGPVCHAPGLQRAGPTALGGTLNTVALGLRPGGRWPLPELGGIPRELTGPASKVRTMVFPSLATVPSAI